METATCSGVLAGRWTPPRSVFLARSKRTGEGDATVRASAPRCAYYTVPPTLCRENGNSDGEHQSCHITLARPAFRSLIATIGTLGLQFG